MAIKDVEQGLTAATTRRKIVTTGAKLAYAAPIVAATSKLAAQAAGAQAVSGTGGCDNPFNPVTCTFDPPDCTGCLVDGVCNTCGQPCAYCTAHVSGGTICVIDYVSTETCSSDADCGAGQACGRGCDPYGYVCMWLCGSEVKGGARAASAGGVLPAR